MLSQISSPHINKTYTTMSESLYNQHNVDTNAFAQKPVTQNNELTQHVQLQPSQDGFYKTLYPVVLQPGIENEISLNIFSTSTGPLICKAVTSGAVDGYCNPLCQKLGQNDQVCKLYLKSKYPGQGVTKIQIMDNLREVASVEIEFQVQAPQTTVQYTSQANQISIGPQALPVATQVSQTQILNDHLMNYQQQSQF